MGKATITGGGTDGLYTVDMDYGRALATARAAKLLTRITALGPQITEAQAAYDAQLAVVAAQGVLTNEAIDAYVLATRISPNPADWADERAAYDAAATKLLTEKAKLAPLLAKLQDLQSTQAQLNKERGYWQSVPVEETRAAWCVDYTEDAAGEVATVDIPGESDRILIAPGGRAQVSTDGELVAREVQDPNQVFWNAAVLPGWQKFKPTYRVGTITALDLEGDTADVALDEAVSSAQSLPINRFSTLTAVPVVYMTCNAQAFEVGDRVVVEFPGMTWDNPRVIGFVSNPKPCLVWPDYVLYRIDLNQSAWANTGTIQVFNQVSGSPLIYSGIESALEGTRALEIFVDDSTIQGVPFVSGLSSDFGNLSIWTGSENTIPALTGGTNQISAPPCTSYDISVGSTFTVKLRQYNGELLTLPNSGLPGAPTATAWAIDGGITAFYGSSLPAITTLIESGAEATVTSWIADQAPPPGVVEVTQLTFSKDYTYVGAVRSGSAWFLRYDKT